MIKRAIVVGGSTGMGAAVVKELVATGYRVAVLARSEDKLVSLAAGLNRGGSKNCFVHTHDVTDAASAGPLFEKIVQELDGLDLIIYCAGIMPLVAEDAYDTEVDHRIMAVNLLGAMTWLNLAAKRFQVQGGGTIMGIGSVAGDRGRRNPGPAYSSSKAALHTYLESLRNRLAPYGVSVVTVKPGPVHTPMTAGLQGMPMAIEVDVAAKGIVKAAGGSNVAYVPGQWMLVMMIIRHIPSIVFRRLSI
jgi:decaprenylphospho-beta-D-erythro-pentofuranosid-2-ulose 2-reductase